MKKESKNVQINGLRLEAVEVTIITSYCSGGYHERKP